MEKPIGDYDSLWNLITVGYSFASETMEKPIGDYDGTPSATSITDSVSRSETMEKPIGDYDVNCSAVGIPSATSSRKQWKSR